VPGLAGWARTPVSGGAVAVAGADVWRGQWVVVVLERGRFCSALLAPTLAAALDQLADVVVVGVDMPIGLPDPGASREAERLARAYVGPRWPSVFIPPSASMARAANHALANELVPVGGTKVSAQAFALGKHILAVQPLAAADERLHEVHPEVSFTCANGDRHLAWPKSSWNGVQLRRSILDSQGIRLPDDLGLAGRAGVADLLDAAIVAWSAERIAAGTAESFPPGAGRIGAIWR
jgi:predicted RNase H-like nuclease